ncbi:MAG: alpha-glucan family phosphorylase [Chloroflexi bacterium]|nr:alpha-glucan family phosphorylase [Chloroflexota bacterium]
MSLTRAAIPERISKLDEIANNLWWTWNYKARELFRRLDYSLWRASGHNPVKQLLNVSPSTYQMAANDPEFLELYDLVVENIETVLSGKDSWFVKNYNHLSNDLIAYFSAEYAIHTSLPIYAGGLGVLSGDTCKGASDLGIPLVAVGLMYPNGYFQQHISMEGWQEEIYKLINFEEAPIRPIFSSKGQRSLTQVQLGSKSVHIGAWMVKVGRVNLYLLDTDIAENLKEDRSISSRLYIADSEQRIQQEIVLGIGGVRVLRVLGINPSVWHANEGHSTFMLLERIREEVVKGSDFQQAFKKVKAATVFTTHTPVPAGHDVFSSQLMDKYFSDYWPSLGIDRYTFMELGSNNNSENDPFNITALALKASDYKNGVSAIHGEVTRKMWRSLWNHMDEDNIPITHITNGVHMPTWLVTELCRIYEKYLGNDFIKQCDDPRVWQHIIDIPDDEFWNVRIQMKYKLLSSMLERARNCINDRECTVRQIYSMGSMLDPNTLTIGFVRRFAEYKRPALLFTNIERLKKIINNEMRPVQLIFAGKSHPADFPSKNLLHQVYMLGSDKQFKGRIAFIEDYDIHIAHYLVHGVDVWLNTPRRLQEACGTSGMKASLNGEINLSVNDGWWPEAYNGGNGWVINGKSRADSNEQQDSEDAETLYNLLEEQVVPLYYDQDRGGVPHGWIKIIKEAIRTISPVFNTNRMLKEYAERMYIPALSQKLSKM